MTRIRLTAALSGLALLLGLAHMSFLLVGPSGWTQNKLWFLGSGLALLSAAVLNLVGRKAPGRTLSGLAVVGINLCLVGFFAAAWPVLKGPQVLVGGALFFALAGVAISRERPE